MMEELINEIIPCKIGKASPALAIMTRGVTLADENVIDIIYAL